MAAMVDGCSTRGHWLSATLQALLVQPAQAGLGYLAPAGVDGQGVTAVGELHQVGDGGRVPVLLEGGLGDGLGHRVVLPPMVSSSGPRSSFAVSTLSGEC